LCQCDLEQYYNASDGGERKFGRKERKPVAPRWRKVASASSTFCGNKTRSCWSSSARAPFTTRKCALEYAARLNDLRRDVADRMEIVMRVYFEKPRTTIGWKGLINDPQLDGSHDIETGLKIARRLLLEITGMGLPAATEFLDPIVPQYISELIAWAAIDARTTESQTHREMASGLSMPIGFKNATDGSMQVAIDAMGASRFYSGTTDSRGSKPDDHGSFLGRRQ
jgi:hypothetical protein